MCWKNYLSSPPSGYVSRVITSITQTRLRRSREWSTQEYTSRFEWTSSHFYFHFRSQIKNIVKHIANITRFFSAVPFAFPIFGFVFLCSFRSLPRGLVSTDPNEWTREAFTLHQSISQNRSRMCTGGECVYVYEQAHVCVYVYHFLLLLIVWMAVIKMDISNSCVTAIILYLYTTRIYVYTECPGTNGSICKDKLLEGGSVELELKLTCFFHIRIVLQEEGR